jgi:hypothetical protein
MEFWNNCSWVYFYWDEMFRLRRVMFSIWADSAWTRSFLFNWRFHSSSFCRLSLARCVTSFHPKRRHPRWTGHSCSRLHASQPKQSGRSKRIGCDRGFQLESQLIEQLIAGESHPCAQFPPAISSTQTSRLNSNVKWEVTHITFAWNMLSLNSWLPSPSRLEKHSHWIGQQSGRIWPQWLRRRPLTRIPGRRTAIQHACSHWQSRRTQPCRLTASGPILIKWNWLSNVDSSDFLHCKVLSAREDSFIVQSNVIHIAIEIGIVAVARGTIIVYFDSVLIKKSDRTMNYNRLNIVNDQVSMWICETCDCVD